MRPVVVILMLALAATCAGTIAASAVEGCRTGDSALCLSDPNCHWDYERRGCYDGAPQQEDACAAHSHQETCDTDLTIGCKWNAESKQCKSVK